MEKSESIGKLAEALSAAQAEIQNAKKDSENPFFKSNYADLASVRAACKDALSKHGLAIVQMPKSSILEDATIISVETLLMHSSGEWISGEVGAIPTKHDPQGIGSCITYLRRYALAAAAGVAAEDDDGNAASHGNQSQTVKRQAMPKKNQVNDARRVLIQGVADAFKALNTAGDVPPWTPKAANEYVALHFQGAADVDQLSDDQVSDLLRMLSERLDALKNGSKKKADIIAAIESNFPGDEQLQSYLNENYKGQTLQQMTIPELETVERDVSIPF